VFAALIEDDMEPFMDVLHEELSKREEAFGRSSSVP